MAHISEIEQRWLDELGTVRRRSFVENLFVPYLISLIVLGLTQEVEVFLIPMLVINILLMLFAIMLFALFNRFSTGTIRQQRLVSWLRIGYMSFSFGWLGFAFLFFAVHFAREVSPLLAGTLYTLYGASGLMSLVVGFFRPDVLRKSFIGIETEEQRTDEQNARVYSRFAAAAGIFFVGIFVLAIGFSILLKAPSAPVAIALFGGIGGWLMLLIATFALGHWLRILRDWLSRAPSQIKKGAEDS
jgi:hypothetical protein